MFSSSLVRSAIFSYNILQEIDVVIKENQSSLRCLHAYVPQGVQCVFVVSSLYCLNQPLLSVYIDIIEYIYCVYMKVKFVYKNILRNK